MGKMKRYFLLGVLYVAVPESRDEIHALSISHSEFITILIEPLVQQVKFRVFASHPSTAK